MLLCLRQIANTLKGMNWIILSGLAVKIYAYPDRKVNDIDILISDWNEFVEASKRFNTEIKERSMDKQKFTTKDKGFDFVVNDIPVEITAGMWETNFKDFISTPKFDEEWLNHIQEKEFFGLKLKLQPLEDLIVQKIAMNRQKDVKDLEHLIKLDIDKEFLLREAKNWNCYDKVVNYIEQVD